MLLAAPVSRPRVQRVRCDAAAAARPDAFSLRCEHFGSCSGCVLSERLEAPPLLEQATAFFQSDFGATFTLHTGPVQGWRNRARLAVRGVRGAPLVGLYQAGTHDVLPIPCCVAHHPSINTLAASLLAAATEAGTAPFQEASGEGQLRYVQLSTLGTAADAPLEVVLVWAGRPQADAQLAPELQALLTALLRAAPPGLLHCVHVNYNSSRGNAIVGEHWQQLHGPRDWHWERFGAADVAFSPAAFLQANYCAFDALLVALGDALPKACHVADVYSGTGAIGLSLLARGVASTLTSIEVVPAAAMPFQASVARLPPALQGRARMHVASAGSGAALAALVKCGAEVCVVDPPRKGLDAPLLRLLCEQRACPQLHTLAYVSCGFKALIRDARTLKEAGWSLARPPEAWQFFPGTDSLETLAIFTRQ